MIAALGWQGIGVVTREYYVRNSQEFIDYVMTGPSGPLLAIEAKPLQTALTEKHAAQLIQYCAVEGIEWAALTNGRELQFFNSFLKPDLAAKRVLRLDLLAFNSELEFDGLFSQIWQLSRDSMTKPSGVRTWLNQRRLDSNLRTILLDPSSPTIRQLRKALSDAEIDATHQDVTQWFRTHLSTQIASLPVASSQTSERLQPYTPVHDHLTRINITSPQFPSRDPRSGANLPTAGLLDALRQAVSRRIPESEWRTTKSYVASEIKGNTFLAVRERRNHLVLGLTLPSSTSSTRLAVNEREFNWARMTKVVQLQNEQDIDDELLAIIDSARFHAENESRSKTYYGITLRDLIENGLLEDGTALTLLGAGNRVVTHAILRTDGAIEFDGNKYRSPSDKVFARLLSRTSLNGWAHWHASLPGGLVSLESVRARLNAATQSDAKHDPSAANTSA